MPIIKKRRKVVEEVIDENEEIEDIKQKLAENIPESGSFRPSTGLTFDDFPISSKTRQGLSKANFREPTDIQAATLSHSLHGRDILGAAKTGSGKTLAFIIPIFERLFLERWDLQDGLAAIIVTPTRELALQIFEVLRVVGKKHQLSAGLVTGGKKEFEEEQARVIKMNILVATPGRLLQHFQQTPGFDASNLMILVLDEADRILDLGFKQQLDDIITYLPSTRQTLLFSATQTKSIKDLARLSLSSPEYIAVHADHQESTPTQLKQNYIICPLHKKLDTLFSFLKTHLKSKLIVFLSSCAQVRFVFECFRGMQPGIPLIALHGKIKQEKRTLIYMDFLRKKHACLFATDIAARGLDFPDVDWVIQVDAPEDSAMYIHRVGRTARHTAGGRGLLMLLPSEEKSTIEELSQAGIPIKKLSMNPNKTVSVSSRAAALLVSNPECRSLAKKSFTSYLKSYLLLPRNKKMGLKDIDTDAFSASLGLAIAPSLPPGAEPAAMASDVVVDPATKPKNINRALDKLKKQMKAAKEEKRLARENALLERAGGVKKVKKQEADNTDNEEEDDLLIPKKSSDSMNSSTTGAAATATLSNVAAESTVTGPKKKKVKTLKIGFDGESAASRRAGAKRVAFDDTGNMINPLEKIIAMKNANSNQESENESDDDDNDDDHENNLKAEVSARVAAARQIIDSGRKEDNIRERQRIKEKHLKLKQKLREERDQQEGGHVGATLSNFIPEEDDEDSNDNDSDSGSGSGNDSGNGNESHSDSDESENEDDDRNGRNRKRKASSDESDGSDESDDSDGSNDDSGDEEEEEDEEESESKIKSREQLALKLLAKKK